MELQSEEISKERTEAPYLTLGRVGKVGGVECGLMMCPGITDIKKDW